MGKFIDLVGKFIDLARFQRQRKAVLPDDPEKQDPLYMDDLATLDYCISAYGLSRWQAVEIISLVWHLETTYGFDVSNLMGFLSDLDYLDPKGELTIREAAESMLGCEDVPNDQKPMNHEPQSDLPTLEKLDRRGWWLDQEGNA